MSRARRQPENFNSMKSQSKNKKSPARRTAKGVGSGRLVRRLKRIVTEGGKFPYGSATRCLDVVEHVFGAHRRMCDNLQTCVQKHKLGLGGEPVDEIVCAKVEELLNGNPAPMAEIEARIKAHTPPAQPSPANCLTHALCQIRRTLDGSQPIDTKGAVMAIDHLITQGGWIAVEDQKPKTGQKVIVCGTWSNGNRWISFARWQPAGTIDTSMWDEVPDDWQDEDGEATNPTDEWMEEAIESETSWSLPRVSHWMPLPEMPALPNNAVSRTDTNT